MKQEGEKRNMRLLLPIEEHPFTIYPSLARELGLVESLILVRMWKQAYELDGEKWWTIAELREDLVSFISTQKISKAIVELEKKELILAYTYEDGSNVYRVCVDGPHIHRVPTDVTFLRDPQERSYAVYYYYTNNNNNKPNTVTEHTERDVPPVPVFEERQKSLFNLKKKKRSPVSLIPEEMHKLMYAICYNAHNKHEIALLSSQQRGHVASVLGRLRDMGEDLNDLNKFREWWEASWYSRDSHTGMYVYPSPQRVLSMWLIATKPAKRERQQYEAAPKQEEFDIEKIMMGQEDEKNGK